MKSSIQTPKDTPKIISHREFLEQIKKTPKLLLLGETHHYPVHLDNELTIVRSFISTDRPVQLALENFDPREYQEAFDKAHRDENYRDCVCERVMGDKYLKDYVPLIRLALGNKCRLTALNWPHDNENYNEMTLEELKNSPELTIGVDDIERFFLEKLNPAYEKMPSDAVMVAMFGNLHLERGFIHEGLVCPRDKRGTVIQKKSPAGIYELVGEEEKKYSLNSKL